MPPAPPPREGLVHAPDERPARTARGPEPAPGAGAMPAAGRGIRVSDDDSDGLDLIPPGCRTADLQLSLARSLHAAGAGAADGAATRSPLRENNRDGGQAGAVLADLMPIESQASGPKMRVRCRASQSCLSIAGRKFDRYRFQATKKPVDPEVGFS